MVSSSFKIAYFAKLPFLFAGFFTASSLLAFYYRLIQESGVRWFRIALHCSVAFNILAWLPFVFTEIFVCMYVYSNSRIFLLRTTYSIDIYRINADKHLNRPIYAYWSFPEPTGTRCLNDAGVTMAGGMVKIAVDLLITTLPIPLILRMNMQKQQRYLVVMLLGLGYLATAAGAVRAYFTWKAFYDTNDQTWYQYPAFIAAALENNIAIVCRIVLSSSYARANGTRSALAFQRYDRCSLIYSAAQCPRYEIGYHRISLDQMVHGSLNIALSLAATASMRLLSPGRPIAAPAPATPSWSYNRPKLSSSPKSLSMRTVRNPEVWEGRITTILILGMMKEQDSMLFEHHFFLKI
jgi:hypothetical protein